MKNVTLAIALVALLPLLTAGRDRNEYVVLYSTAESVGSPMDWWVGDRKVSPTSANHCLIVTSKNAPLVRLGHADETWNAYVANYQRVCTADRVPPCKPMASRFSPAPIMGDSIDCTQGVVIDRAVDLLESEQ